MKNLYLIVREDYTEKLCYECYLVTDKCYVKIYKELMEDVARYINDNFNDYNVKIVASDSITDFIQEYLPCEIIPIKW